MHTIMHFFFYDIYVSFYLHMICHLIYIYKYKLPKLQPGFTGFPSLEVTTVLRKRRFTGSTSEASYDSPFWCVRYLELEYLRWFQDLSDLSGAERWHVMAFTWIYKSVRPFQLVKWPFPTNHDDNSTCRFILQARGIQSEMSESESILFLKFLQ